jgi:hypothetical protein
MQILVAYMFLSPNDNKTDLVKEQWTVLLITQNMTKAPLNMF